MCLLRQRAGSVHTYPAQTAVSFFFSIIQTPDAHAERKLYEARESSRSPTSPGHSRYGFERSSGRESGSSYQYTAAVYLLVLVAGGRNDRLCAQRPQLNSNHVQCPSYHRRPFLHEGKAHPRSATYFSALVACVGSCCWLVRIRWVTWREGAHPQLPYSCSGLRPHNMRRK